METVKFERAALNTAKRLRDPDSYFSAIAYSIRGDNVNRKTKSYLSCWAHCWRYGCTENRKVRHPINKDAAILQRTVKQGT